MTQDKGNKMKWIHKSLWFHMVALIIFLSLPATVTAILVNNRSYEEMRNAEEQAVTQMVAENARSLGNTMTTGQRLIMDFVSENKDVNLLSTAWKQDDNYKVRKIRIWKELERLQYRNKVIDGFFLYLPRTGDYIAVSKDPMQELVLACCDDLEKAEAGNGWVIEPDNEILIMRINGNRFSYGCWIDAGDELETLKAALRENMTVLIRETSDETDTEENNPIASGELINSSLQVCVYGTGPDLSWRRRSLVYAALVSFYVLSIPLLILIIYLTVIKPLQAVTRANRSVNQGNLDYRIEETSRFTEMQEAYESFNTMVENIRNLRIDNYEKEKEKQQIQLRNLQLQIRPHFLLNTFSLIYSLAQDGERENLQALQDIILYLSDYFRYLFRFRTGDEMILFEIEYKLICGYIRMTQVRYKDRVFFEADVDDALLQVRVPPLVLHNFVENAIKYGLNPDFPMHIRFLGHLEEDTRQAVFVVSDDGNGMEEEALERLRAIFSGSLNMDQETEHIGLYNAYKRLDFYFGRKASVEVISEPGEGSIFTIRIPADSLFASETEGDV